MMQVAHDTSRVEVGIGVGRGVGASVGDVVGSGVIGASVGRSVGAALGAPVVGLIVGVAVAGVRQTCAAVASVHALAPPQHDATGTGLGPRGQ